MRENGGTEKGGKSSHLSLIMTGMGQVVVVCVCVCWGNQFPGVICIPGKSLFNDFTVKLVLLSVLLCRFGR